MVTTNNPANNAGLANQIINKTVSWFLLLDLARGVLSITLLMKIQNKKPSIYMTSKVIFTACGTSAVNVLNMIILLKELHK